MQHIYIISEKIDILDLRVVDGYCSRSEGFHTQDIVEQIYDPEHQEEGQAGNHKPGKPSPALFFLHCFCHLEFNNALLSVIAGHNSCFIHHIFSLWNMASS